MKKVKSVSRNISEILFIDIETCALASNYKALNETAKKHWDQKADRLKKPNDSDFGASKDVFYKKRAGIYAEFSRVVCISVGYVDVLSKHKAIVNTKTFFHLNERDLLLEFADFLNLNTVSQGISFLCGHNLREFDIPFICRRMLINNVQLPDFIRISGKKPWQISFIIDTLELWKFGDYKSYISLDLLCSILNVTSPKSEMMGSDVHDFFWVKKDYESICRYCELDVFSTAQVYLKLKQIYQSIQIEYSSKSVLST